MSDLDRLLSLAGLSQSTQQVAEAGEKKMVCKDCGDEFGHPTSDCENSAYDKDGDHWIEIDVDGDGDADIKVASDYAKKDGMDEAVGDSAEAFYNMQDEFAGGEADGAHKVLIDELVRYLSGDQVADFVSDFKRHHMEEAVTESEGTFVGINTETGDFESGLSHEEVTSGRFTHMLPDDTTYFDPDTAEELVGAPDEEMEAMGWEKVPANENAFNQAAAAAARAGKDSFEFDGKTHKTTMKRDTAHKLNDSVSESSCGCCGNDPCDCGDDCSCKESVNEGGYKDQIIDDAQSMDLEDFIEKHEGYGMDRKECIEQWKYINGVKESEEISEAPTMDTTQLVTLLKNAGLTEEAIEAKLNEWANTPEGVGEVEPTDHGEAYEFAQSVNLSLKRYLDAADMKVQVSESHTVEGMKDAYKKTKE